MSHRRSPFPPESVGWALPNSSMTALAVNHLGGFAEVATRRGHRVTAVASSRDEAERMARRVNAGAVYATPRALPFAAHSFDRVIVGEGMADSDVAAALPEAARILRPGGQAVLILTSRDDTVPWVRRLASLVQQLDPTAMQGAAGTSAVQLLAECDHFGDTRRRTFRNWVPITRRGLIDMIMARPAVRRCAADLRNQVLTEVGELYDHCSRSPDALLLPFETTMWQAPADHSQMPDVAHTESVRIMIGTP